MDNVKRFEKGEWEDIHHDYYYYVCFLYMDDGKLRYWIESVLPVIEA